MMGWMAPSLIAIVRDEDDARLPDLARQVLQVLAAQISREACRFIGTSIPLE